MKVMITGGTGSLGRALINRLLQTTEVKSILVLSRDELKQFELKERLGHPEKLETIIGDVRDYERTAAAMEGCDVVIHTAALKQVPVCEYNPIEAIRTNIMGTVNVCQAAHRNDVSKMITISTDKAVNPVNMYGATKLCAEKTAIQANLWGRTRYSLCRYGNVFMSRGSVVPFFMERVEKGEPIPITHSDMTRFWITLPIAAEFVLDCVGIMHGGEIFIPKQPSIRIVDLAKAICEDCEFNEVGIRPGEKLHEVLITRDEVPRTKEHTSYFCIEPAFGVGSKWLGGKKLSEGFQYTSDQNDVWLSVEELRERVYSEEEGHAR